MWAFQGNTKPPTLMPRAGPKSKIPECKTIHSEWKLWECATARDNHCQAQQKLGLALFSLLPQYVAEAPVYVAKAPSTHESLNLGFFTFNTILKKAKHHCQTNILAQLDLSLAQLSPSLSYALSYVFLESLSKIKLRSEIPPNWFLSSLSIKTRIMSLVILAIQPKGF